jgi:hypothetical protein
VPNRSQVAAEKHRDAAARENKLGSGHRHNTLPRVQGSRGLAKKANDPIPVSVYPGASEVDEDNSILLEPDSHFALRIGQVDPQVARCAMATAKLTRA